jgi:large repetitive protein
MDPNRPPTPPGEALMRRPPRPRRRWSFEWLERRILLSGAPIVATPGELARAQPLTGDTVTGTVAPGEVALYRIDPTTDGRWIARVHADNAITRLSLLDDQGRLIVQSDGQSSGARDDLIDQHIPAGTEYFEVESLTGAGAFALTATFTASNPPDQPVPGPASPQDPQSNIPSSIIADFNGDGIPDLAASDGVHLGVGDGTFRDPLPGGAITFPTFLNGDHLSMLAGDFNRDGRTDLALAYCDPISLSGGNEQGGVSLYLGRGDGTFQAPVQVVAGVQANSLVAGDFNRDGHLDLAFVAGTPDIPDGTIDTLLGRGDGTFQAPVQVARGVQATSLVTGDFNSDGHTDLAFGVRNYERFDGDLSDGVYLLPDRGDNTFGTPVQVAAGTTASDLVAGYFNGDGHVDLAFDSSDGTDVLLGQGGGTFQGPIQVASNVFESTTGDFNGDGRIDLVGVSSWGDLITLLGRGDGKFEDPVKTVLASDLRSIAAGDLNGDGRTDLALGLHGLQGISVLLSRGDGTFRGPNQGELKPSRSFATGDFNLDGRTDLVTIATISNLVTYGSAGDITVLLGRGDGTFQPPVRIKTLPAARSVIVGDFNGDGRPDLAVAVGNTLGRADRRGSYGIYIFRGRGDGTFVDPVQVAAGAIPNTLVAGDFNDDGRTDLAVAEVDSIVLADGQVFPGPRNGIIDVLWGRGDGTFQDPRPVASNDPSGSLVTADFNGDGHPDLAYLGPLGSGPLVFVLLGRGNGTFQAPVSSASGGFGDSLVVGDFNQDGLPDLAVLTITLIVDIGGSPFSNELVDALLLGRGNGTFQDPMHVAVDTSTDHLGVGDFNGNGRPVLALFNNAPSRLTLVNGPFLPGAFPHANPFDPVPTGTFLQAITTGDFNGDGRPDLVLPTSDVINNPVTLNLSDGTLANPSTIATSLRATPLVADIDQDGVNAVLVVNQAGNILWRRGRPGAPGSFDPPATVNPVVPARDIAVVSTASGPLIAAVDARNNQVSLYAYRSSQFVRVGQLQTGLLPAQVVSADLNGDRLADLVVRNAGDGTVSLFLGDGNGGFTRRPDLPIGPDASDIALADIDRPGTLDLVVTNQAAGVVRVLLNQGDATFGPASIYHAGAGPYWLVVGADGLPALTSFEQTADVAVGALIAGGNLDLVAANPGSNTFTVLAGLGGGAFANPQQTFTGSPAQVARVADVNNDGIPDVVTLGTDSVEVFLGNGRGGFAAPLRYPAGPEPTGLTIAYVNGDGKLDLLVGNSFGDVLVLLGNGDGTFQPYRKTDQSVALAVADFGNGTKALIFANQGLDHVVIDYGGVQQTFTGLLAPGAVTVTDPIHDLNGDKIPDLIVANSGSNNVLVYLGLGNGQFGPALNGGHGFFAGTNPVGISVADVNGDGRPDLVVANKGSNDVSILLNQPQGNSLTFTPGPRLKAGSGPVSTVVQDVTGDGIPDILVSDSQSNQVRLLRGIGQGFFNDTNPQIFDVGVQPGPLFVGNFTRPGQLDLVTVNAGSNDLTLIPDFLHGGQPQEFFSGGTYPVAALPDDFNGDGLTDLLVANNGDGRLALFLGGLDGLDLAASMEDLVGLHPTALALDALTGNLLRFYVGTEGGDPALLELNVPAAPVTPAVLLAQLQLQPLSESSLALIATLLIVPEDTTPGESEATNAVPAGSPDAAGALPNQPSPPVSVVDGTGDDADTEDQEEGEAAQVVPTPAVLTPLARFVSGLDEAFEKVRLDAQRGKIAPGPRAAVAAREILALDAALERWSPVITTLGGPVPALVGGLGRIVGAAARAVDAALHALSEEGVRTPPPTAAAGAEATPSSPPEQDATPMVAAVASIGLIAVAKVLVDDRHHRPLSNRRSPAPSPAKAAPGPSERMPHPAPREEGMPHDLEPRPPARVRQGNRTPRRTEGSGALPWCSSCS